jgi:RNA polymerase sigma-70 factor (ECF subfamily)
METTDEQLTEHIADGPDAFAGLYDRYLPKIYAYLYYRVQHRETVEDLAGDTFMKALAAFESFDAEKGTFSAWIYRIARNILFDHFRKTGRRPVADAEDIWSLLSTGEDVARDADARLRMAQVDAAMTKLDAGARELLLLRIWDGLSYREIAEITGRTEDASKMAVSRALKRLREALPPALLLALLLPLTLPSHYG